MNEVHGRDHIQLTDFCDPKVWERNDKRIQVC